MKTDLFKRPSPGIGAPIHNVAFSGQGTVPDLASEQGLRTFPEANATTLEEGVYGSEGMMPPPGVLRPLIPGQPEGGTGGSGAFNNSPQADKRRV